MTSPSVAVLLAAISQAQATPVPVRPRVEALRIVILSTMLADRGIGEWGFAALVEVDGHRLLFDTGGRPDTVLLNAKEMGIDWWRNDPMLNSDAAKLAEENRELRERLDALEQAPDRESS